MKNECDICTGQPYPGILSHHVTWGRTVESAGPGGIGVLTTTTGRRFREFDEIERCDTCARFGNDEAAREFYGLATWAQRVIDAQNEEGDVLTLNIDSMAVWLAAVQDETSEAF